MNRYTFPANYGECTYLVPIDKSMIPIVSGMLAMLEQPWAWESADDHALGYQALQEIRIAMSGRCLQELITIQQATYRLLDSSLNGAIYTTGAPLPDGSIPITPAIPVVPASPAIPAAANYNLRNEQRELYNLLRRIIAGANPGDPLPSDSVLVALRGSIEASDSRNVIDAISGFTDEEKQDLFAKLLEIIVLLG